MPDLTEEQLAADQLRDIAARIASDPLEPDRRKPLIDALRRYDYATAGRRERALREKQTPTNDAFADVLQQKEEFPILRSKRRTRP